MLIASTYIGDGFLVDLVDLRSGKGGGAVGSTEIDGLNLARSLTGCLFFVSDETFPASVAILKVSAETTVDDLPFCTALLKALWFVNYLMVVLGVLIIDPEFVTIFRRLKRRR